MPDRGSISGKVAMKYPKDQLDILLVSLDDNPDNVRDVLKKGSIAWESGNRFGRTSGYVDRSV